MAKLCSASAEPGNAWGKSTSVSPRLICTLSNQPSERDMKPSIIILEPDGVQMGYRQGMTGPKSYKAVSPLTMLCSLLSKQKEINAGMKGQQTPGWGTTP